MPWIHTPTSIARTLSRGGFLALGLVLGCGANEYESRLKESAKYYRYMDNIEQNLALKWSDGIVESLRVPKQFQTIPAPVPAKKEDGAEELPVVDQRLPTLLTINFPITGLLGAWEAPFSIPLADGKTDTVKGYIYVLSNYWMFLGEEPMKFAPAMVQLVGDALEDPIPPEKMEQPTIEAHPKRGMYLPEVSYNVYEFHPKPIKLPGKDETVNYTFTMYVKVNGDVQGIILLAIPASVSSQEKIAERTSMMLDHFQVTKTPPRPGQGGSGPAAGAPSAGF